MTQKYADNVTKAPTYFLRETTLTNKHLEIPPETANTTVVMATSYKLPQVESDVPATVYSHKTAIIVIMSIFITITMSVTIAIFVFCRKKNSVFALQKCEEQDIETVYEMDDMNTEIELSDDETVIEDELSLNTRSKTFPSMSRLCQYDMDSPTLYAPTTTASSIKSRSFPRSKTCTVIQNRRTKNPREVSLLQNKQQQNSNVKRPSSLPLSSSFSSVSLSTNYQSMLVVAEVESSQSDKRLKDTKSPTSSSKNQNDTDSSFADETTKSYEDLRKSPYDGDDNTVFIDDDEDIHVCTPLLQSVINADNSNPSKSKITSPKLPNPCKNSSGNECLGTNYKIQTAPQVCDVTSSKKQTTQKAQLYNHRPTEAAHKHSQVRPEGQSEKNKTSKTSTSKTAKPMLPNKSDVTSLKRSHVTQSSGSIQPAAKSNRNVLKSISSSKRTLGSPESAGISGKLQFNWDSESETFVDV